MAQEWYRAMLRVARVEDDRVYFDVPGWDGQGVPSVDRSLIPPEIEARLDEVDLLLIAYVTLKAKTSADFGIDISTLEIAPKPDPMDGLDPTYEATADKLLPAYLPLGENFIHPDKTMRVFAVGRNVEECIRFFAWTINDEVQEGSIQELEGGSDPKLQWGRAWVTSKNGTSMKCAGCYVPGGVVMTWWK